MNSGVVIAIIGAVAAITGSYYTASATSAARVNDLDTKVEVLQERQSLQYTEVKAALDRIEKKLDNPTSTDKPEKQQS